jgi:toxin YoeB
MNIKFSPEAWADYLFWQKNDKKILKRINELLRDIKRGPFDGLGKPEPLRFELGGFWSRRIDLEHRLVYRVIDDSLEVLSCRFHYR